MNNSVYNYKENVKVIATPNGDVVITMNRQILTVLKNQVFEASESLQKKGLKASAEDVLKLWDALNA